ncbi:MAG: hypothetical protein AAGD01_08930 [Acidobacteriota bacterium]
MPQIPAEIGGVVMEFNDGVNRQVTQELFDALNATIRRDAVEGHEIQRLFVSSAADRHQCPSRHVTGNAVDISRINGKKMSVHYSSDAEVKAIVDGLQTAFEAAPNRRENFGPSIRLKLGQPFTIGGHNDHFHWSVNGDHSACTPSVLERVMGWVAPGPPPVLEEYEEICTT